MKWDSTKRVSKHQIGNFSSVCNSNNVLLQFGRPISCQTEASPNGSRSANCVCSGFFCRQLWESVKNIPMFSAQFVSIHDEVDIAFGYGLELIARFDVRKHLGRVGVS